MIINLLIDSQAVGADVISAEEGSGADSFAAEDRARGRGEGESSAPQVHAPGATEGDQKGAGTGERRQGRHRREIPRPPQRQDRPGRHQGDHRRGTQQTRLLG